MTNKTAIIIGAGPAGLTTALELLRRTDIKPIVFEVSHDIGGISKTVNYKGNRIDIGGHRFFSKSERVMNWWRDLMPIQAAPSRDQLQTEITYHGKTRSVELAADGPDPEKTDRLMLIRRRISRILYGRRFYSYPVSLSVETIRNLGLIRMGRIGFSYLYARAVPIRNERSLEDFLINRFGRQLYLTFFKDYTEKVWGVRCDQIPASWGAQRIKGLSITTAVLHALKSVFRRNDSIEQKDVETSLIEKFMYPKLGPGQLWEEVARLVEEGGGEIHMGCNVVGIHADDGKVDAITVAPDAAAPYQVQGDYFFSTMPIKDLINAFQSPVPANVAEVANGLQYRDFITVGLLLTKLQIQNNTDVPTLNDIVPDNWIYVQEPDVKVGRLQIFNNWSPYMVRDPDTVWLGMEYFCNEGDELWNRPDDELMSFAAQELEKIGVIKASDVLDSTIIRVPKTYPAYFGAYEHFDAVRDYIDGYSNLYLLGRNGQHRYNNADHSMLTAMVAVDNIVQGVTDKENVWAVNTEQDYHETKRADGH